jgi:predicted transcriptional regulator
MRLSLNPEVIANMSTPAKPEAKTKRKKRKLKESVKMWGKPVLGAGFTIVPSTLLLKQRELGLDSVDMNILMHLLVTWWKKEKPPFLSKKTVARRMKLDPSTIQRHVRKMEGLGILKRIERHGNNKSRQTNAYDLRPLATALHPLATDVRRGRAKRKERAEQKGGKP